MRQETMQDILAADDIGTRYDQASKRIWRNWEILAPLLKYAIEELADESVESIMKLIDADSIDEGVAVSDLPATVVQMNQEVGSTTDTVITFDLRLVVKNPKLSKRNILVVLHIDLEFQNEYRPTLKDGRSYPLIKRGIYYVAREISEQLGNITENTNYDDLEKVVGIWIVNDNIPKEVQGTATRYYFTKEDFIGETDEPDSDHDLMEIIMIRRGKNVDMTKPLFEYLESVYRADIEKIEKYTPIEENADLKKEVSEMPGMSSVIYNDGIQQGMQRMIVNLVIAGKITLEDAAEQLNSNSDEIQKLVDASKEEGNASSEGV